MTKHKRLTTKEKYPHGAEGISEDKLTGKYCRGVFEATACVEKLAEYETAEEEGRLMIFPFKVGDKIYVPEKWLGLTIIHEIAQIHISIHGVEIIDMFGNEYDIKALGKRFFLSSEEAAEAFEDS